LNESGKIIWDQCFHYITWPNSYATKRTFFRATKCCEFV
jgi:hypothetical protein